MVKRAMLLTYKYRFIFPTLRPLRHLWMSQKVRRCLPQALTRYAIEAALKLMLLSKSKAMKMGFNSLCAYASVNHLHWHLYYLQDGFEG